MLLSNRIPVNQFTYRDPSRAEIAAAAHALDLEYRATGVSLDAENIDSRVRSFINADRLKTYSVYMPIVPKIINSENNTYIKPPMRHFTRANGKPVSKTVQARIDELYHQMKFNTRMLEYERQAAYEGTLLARPTIDIDTKQMSIIKLTPADLTVEVKPEVRCPDKIEQLVYAINTFINVDGVFKEATITYKWDKLNVTVITKIDNVENIEVNEHKFKESSTAQGGVPWATLRYISDSTRYWGPYDGGLLSLCQLRSLLLADSVHRTQANLYELLILAGFTSTEALEATRTSAAGRVIQYENDKDAEGTPIKGSKEVKFISPTGIEPEKVWEIWDNILTQWMRMRGHSPKNFETSADPQSAEAQRLSDVALRDIQISRRQFLAGFEQDMFELVKWENNTQSNTVTIPEDTRVELDWPLDHQIFISASDKVSYYTFALNSNVLTPVDIIRAENPDLSEQMAVDLFNKNKEFNKEFNNFTKNEADALLGEDDV